MSYWIARRIAMRAMQRRMSAERALKKRLRKEARGQALSARYAQDAYDAYKDEREEDEQEVATEDAIDEMLSMCVNPGQETIIMLGADPFHEWAQAFFNDDATEGDLPGFLSEAIYDEQYDGTDDIWDTGAARIAEKKSDQNGQADLAKLRSWLDSVTAKDVAMGKGSKPDLNPGVPGFQWKATSGGSDVGYPSQK